MKPVVHYKHDHFEVCWTYFSQLVDRERPPLRQPITPKPIISVEINVTGQLTVDEGAYLYVHSPRVWHVPWYAAQIIPFNYSYEMAFRFAGLTLLPSPFASGCAENFNMESHQSNWDLCRFYSAANERESIRQCRPNCEQELYDVTLLRERFVNESKIQFTLSRSSKNEFHHAMIQRVSFLKTFSRIGGMIPLFLEGCTVSWLLQLGHIIGQTIIPLLFLFYEYATDKFHYLIALYYQIRAKMLAWKISTSKICNIICYMAFLYQTVDLLVTYYSYKTFVGIEMMYYPITERNCTKYNR